MEAAFEHMPPEPPPGWTEFQERAKRAEDSKGLAAIIDEMNQLLAEYEKAAGDGHEPDRGPVRDSESTRKNEQ